jgi:hypothetical protein
VKVKLHIFLNLTLDGGDLVGLMHQPLYPTGGEFPMSIEYEVGWTLGPVWTFWRSEKSPAPV